MIASNLIRNIYLTEKKRRLKRIYGCKFEHSVILDRHCKIQGYVDIQCGTQLKSSILEKGTNIGKNNVFVQCKIGKFCLFGDYNRNIYGHHPINYVAMHSFFYQPQKHGYVSKVTCPHETLYQYADKEKNFFNIIGNDVYITNNVLILEGVKIGDGAIVTPGSVVTKNVPPYAIVRGNPAKIVAYRFKTDEIAFLKKLKWWDRDDDWIRKHADDFNDIKKLIERVNKEEG